MTTVKLSKERIKAEKHDFSSEELFSLLQKYFFEFKKAYGLYLSKYYSRCAVKKVQTIRLNAKSGHQTVIGDFLIRSVNLDVAVMSFIRFHRKTLPKKWLT
jgi:hypothetical protein